jgi:hypothetical protein
LRDGILDLMVRWEGFMTRYSAIVRLVRLALLGCLMATWCGAAANAASRSTKTSVPFVIDSRGSELGVFYPAFGSGGGQVLRSVNGTVVSVFVSPSGFPDSHDVSGGDPSFFYTSSDCTGTKYVVPNLTSFYQPTSTFKGTVYFPQGPAQALTVRSIQFLIDPKAVCEAFGSPSQEFLSSTGTFDLSGLGFVPPLRLILPQTTPGGD